MSFTYTDQGREWHLWTDAEGVVHDEPVTAPAQEQAMEASE